MSIHDPCAQTNNILQVADLPTASASRFEQVEVQLFTTNVAQRQEIELLKFRQAQRCRGHVLDKQHLVKSTNRFV